MSKTQIQIGDFVKDLSFDPSPKGRVIGVDEKRPNSFIVKMTDGSERNIRSHNLEILPQKVKP